MPDKQTTQNNPNDVDYQNIAYRNMKCHWELLHDLLGGTKAMREARTKWLPQESKEKSDAYNNRLSRSFLYDAYSDTIDKCSSKPFSKPVTVDNPPAKLEMMADDVDGTGKDISEFANELFDIGSVYGIYHVLVEYPIVPDAEKLKKNQEKATGARPLFIVINPTNLIGWRTAQGLSGEPVLTQIRIQETVIEPDGEYGEKEVQRIRVYDTENVEVFQKDEGDDSFKPIKDSKQPHTFGSVPLVTGYFKRTGFMKALPPLEKLAYLNLAHWQSSSDQRNILRFARFALLFGSGFTQDEIDKGFEIGPTRLIASTNAEAEIGYVEHTGKAIEAGNKDIEHLEEQMEVLGLEPFLKKRTSSTATSAVIDESSKNTDIQSWIREMETTIETAYAYAGKWIGVEIADNFKISIFSEFSIGFKSTDDVKVLQTMRDKRDLSHGTFIDEVKRRGMLADDVTAEDEMNKLDEEAPSFGDLRSIPPDEEDVDINADLEGVEA